MLGKMWKQKEESCVENVQISLPGYVYSSERQITRANNPVAVQPKTFFC